MNLRSRPPSTNQMSSLQIADLHEDYRGVSHEEAIAMANLGAVSYRAVKKELYDQWSASMEGDEAVKADAWRAEERQRVLDSVRTKLVAAEEMSARLISAEGTINQLRASVEAEASRRLAEALEGHRKDFEISKMAEISGLKERIATFEGKEGFIQIMLDSQGIMKEKIAALEIQLAQQIADNTKSSHAIGKAGEATVLDLLENTVCKQFTHSVVKDMTGVSHVADFHLWVMDSKGQKVKILIDSKKYKRPVNSDEIIKLYTDMDADDECRCGIMISITSAICTKHQFGISRTIKQKPVLFLTFQNMPTDSQKEILCWGIQVLSELVGEKRSDEQQEMVNNLEQFIDTINGSIKDIESIIRTQLKSVESLREVRGKLFKDLSRFRTGKTHEESIDVDEKTKNGCVTIVKATGFPCGRHVVENTDKCRHHTSRVGGKKSEGEIVHLA